jgi:mono/diheme cytochrome c family protein
MRKADSNFGRLRWMIYGVLATLGCAAAGGVAFLYSGLYNVAATSDHSEAVYWVLEQGMRASVQRRAASVKAPAFMDEAMLRRGAHCFDANCAQCHGAPGKAPMGFALGMLPTGKSLVQTARDWPIEQIYWVTRNGIRTTAMPAWEFRLADEELWAIAAFVHRELPQLTVQQYRERVADAAALQCEVPAEQGAADAERGLVAMRQYGCHGCHIIPGVSGPQVHVGPPLAGFATRALVAGKLANTPENVVRWLRDPQAVSPRSLMPHLGVTAQHARDIQAHLATLH